MFVDGEFWGLYLVGRVNTAETFARRAGGSPEEIQVIENRYPSQIAPEYGELYRLVTEGNTSGHGTYQKILEQMEREPMALRDRLRLQKELFDSFRRLPISISVIRSLTLFPPLCGDGQEKERRENGTGNSRMPRILWDGIRSVITV